MRNALAGIFVFGLILAISGQAFGLFKFGPSLSEMRNAPLLPGEPCAQVDIEVGAPGRLVDLTDRRFCVVIYVLGTTAMTVDILVQTVDDYRVTPEFPLSNLSGDDNPYQVASAKEFLFANYCYHNVMKFFFVYLKINPSRFDVLYDKWRMSTVPRLIVSARATN